MATFPLKQDPIVDAIPFPLLVLDRQGRADARGEKTTMVRAVNKAASRLLGYTAAELTDRPFAQLLADGDERSLFSAETWATLRREGTLCGLERSFRTKRGETVPVLLAFSIPPDSSETDAAILCLAQNDSRRRRTLEDLSIMSRAVDQSPNAVVITDIDGRIEYANPKFCQLTGYALDELIGRNPKIMQSGDTTPQAYRDLWQTILSGQEWRGEIKNRRKDGQRYWARECISPIRGANGEITHFLAIQEDITPRRKAELALKESEERFRQMAEMTGEWLWEQNPDGYYIYSSAAVTKILGYRPDEVVGRHYSELFTAEDRRRLQETASVHQPFFSIVNHYCHKDGHLVFTESTGLPIMDSQGRLIKWRGVDRDITARKHFEDALKASEKRTRLIIENAMDAIVIMDQEGFITDWNPKAETLFGWTKAEAVGRPMDDTIIPQRYRRAHRSGLEHFLRSGEGTMLNRLLEQTALHRSGREFPVEISISPLRLDDGYVFSGFIRDITERKQAEKEIRQAQVKLAVAYNEMKIARQIQQSLLPSKPLNLEGIQVMGYCLPAAQVGGDYFDYFHRQSDSIDLVIADVSGHSIGPGLFMVETRSALRSHARLSINPAGTLAHLNETLYEDLCHSDYFITMFYMQYHCPTRRLTYANAGHPKPLLLRPGEPACMALDSDGLVLGVRRQVDFEERHLHLEAGDLILLYTDGITEAQSPEGEFFGTDRLCHILNQNKELAPPALIQQVTDALQDFCQTNSFEDDITLLVFKCI